MIESYPLQWPEGFPRTKRPERSRFGKITLSRAMNEVYDEVRLLIGKRPDQALHGTECIISTNMRRRKTDGGIYANEKEPSDSGVAVYFMYHGQMRSVACDRWSSVKENMHAIGKTLDAMRGIDRWGASDMLNRMFTGFAAIPERTESSNWRSILGAGENATIEEVRRVFRKQAKKKHPDTGGSDQDMLQLRQALEEAERELKS